MADWVVIVDDDATNQMLAERILKKNGFRVSAFSSGQEFLDFTVENDVPDLVLLDIKMPGMDGFETLSRYKKIEKAKDVPVIFLTGDEKRGTETKGLSMGATDFIRKPFIPDVLILRVKHTIRLEQLQRQLENEVVKKTEEAKTDAMTGLLNKVASEEAIGEVVRETDGMLAMVDLDSFKLVNDLYGHDMGDKILIRFAGILRSQTREGDIAGRVGGVEFVLFLRHLDDESAVENKVRLMNDGIVEAARELMGEDMEIPIGVSSGAVSVPEYGTDYADLIKKADEALYQVKQNGKHGFLLYKSSEERKTTEKNSGLWDVKKIYAERDLVKGAIVAGREAFRIIYRFQSRLLYNNKWEARLASFSISVDENADLGEATDHFIETAAGVLRRSDVIVRHGEGRVLILLAKVNDENYPVPITRLMGVWNELDTPGVSVEYESEPLEL